MGVYGSVTALEARAVNEERACTEPAGEARRSPSQQSRRAQARPPDGRAARCIAS